MGWYEGDVRVWGGMRVWSGCEGEVRVWGGVRVVVYRECDVRCRVFGRLMLRCMVVAVVM